MSGLLQAGTILATDYGHVRDEREAHYRSGTLVGYRAGRVVPPVPNGAANLTAHVAWDACAAAVAGTRLTSQRDEVRHAPIGEQPGAADVERYFASLRLRDPARRGGLGWLRWDARS
jgi:SAM-dependent MidA family methyltransferase